MDLDVATLRELFRNLVAFRSLYESEGVDVIQGPDGREWSLWDLEYLYREAQERLPDQQKKAIELCLVRNIKESDAAVMMGVSSTNPVAAYATLGLEKIVRFVKAGALSRYRQNDNREATG